jgi:thiol-disulfide isomerase/thioredoxin
MKTLLFASILAFLAGCSKAPLTAAAPTDYAAKLLKPGAVAPDFTAYRADGTPVKLSDFKGKPVLIDFWATWCPDCKAVMPQFEKLNRKVAPQGVMVLGVCVWDTKEAFAAWDKKPEIPTTYLKVFDPAGRAEGNIAGGPYGVIGIPTVYLIDPEGKVAFSAVGDAPETEGNLARALGAAGIKL